MTLTMSVQTCIPIARMKALWGVLLGGLRFGGLDMALRALLKSGDHHGAIFWISLKLTSHGSCRDSARLRVLVSKLGCPPMVEVAG